MHAYEASLQVWFHCAGPTDEGAMSCPTTLHRILGLATLDAQPVRGNHTGVQRLFANLRNHMPQSHKSDGLGHDCLKRIATMQVEGLALVKLYALGISLHVLHYDGLGMGWSHKRARYRFLQDQERSNVFWVGFDPCRSI